MIPQVLHRTVPTSTHDNVETWWQQWCDVHDEAMHGWTHHTWRDPIDVAEFPISQHVWRFCTSGAQLAGLVRLEALYHHGGVYLDSDVEPVPGARLDPLLSIGPVVVCSEDGVHLTDAVIAAEPDHPAIAEALVRAVRMIEHAVDHDAPIPGAQATGPLNLTAAWRGRDDVTVLARRVFYPYSYTERERSIEPASTFDRSIGVHRWAFSWDGT